MKIFLDTKLAKIFPSKAFNELDKRTSCLVKNDINVNIFELNKDFQRLGDIFIKKNKKQKFNRKMFMFAEKMEQLSCFDICGAVLKFLIDINKENLDFLERIAKKRISISEQKFDVFGILSANRALAKIYSKSNKRGCDRHIESLITSKNILTSVIENYDSASQKFGIHKLALKTKDNYEIQLSSILMEKAKLELENSPRAALQDLEHAYDLVSKYGEGTMTERIQGLMRCAKYNIRRQEMYNELKDFDKF